MIYLADSRQVITISGLGTWPQTTTLEMFVETHGGHIPPGLLRTVVPAAPDAWITALEQYGTMGFGDVAASAIRFAADGFPMYPFMAERITERADDFRRWSSNAQIYLPGGHPPNVGDLFRQTDLARSLQYMADEEQAAAGEGRAAGLQAARHAFYSGDLAATIVDFHRQHDGLLTIEDMAGFRVGIEAPVHTRFAGVDVYACGPWCQGPALLQMLSILEGIDLSELGHNSPAYLHTMIEAMKLSLADRERFYGDPRFVEVPRCWTPATPRSEVRSSARAQHHQHCPQPATRAAPSLPAPQSPTRMRPARRIPRWTHPTSASWTETATPFRQLRATSPMTRR